MRMSDICTCARRAYARASARSTDSSFDGQRDVASVALDSRARSRRHSVGGRRRAPAATHHGRRSPPTRTAEVEQHTVVEAIAAVEAGCGSAVIMDGRVPHCSLVHFFGEGGVGTAVVGGD